VSGPVHAPGGLRQKMRAWYWAGRPFTLSASVVPIVVGSALAFRDGVARPGLLLLMLLASLLVQVVANLVDEFSDHARPEGKEKLLAPYKVIALGLLSSKSVKVGAAVCFGIATVIGLYMVSVAGWPVLAICLAGAATAYLYSAGPKPLGVIGLGQPLVFLFMGPAMVLGSYYVYAKAFTWVAFLISLPVGFTITAILAANDLRDLEEDRSAGKVTPVTLFGRTFGKAEWTLLVTAAFLLVVILVLTGILGPLALLSLLALFPAIKAFKGIAEGKDRIHLAPALRSSGRLNLVFGLLLAVGVAMQRFVSL